MTKKALTSTTPASRIADTITAASSASSALSSHPTSMPERRASSSSNVAYAIRVHANAKKTAVIAAIPTTTTRSSEPTSRMFPKRSCSGSNAPAVRGALRSKMTPNAKHTAKRIAMATSERRPPRLRSAPIATAASAVNGMATTSGAWSPKNIPSAIPPKAA